MSPYFHFRFVWPTDLESIPHASTPTSIIPTKFEVDMTIHCRVIAFCLLIRHVTLWPWPFDLEQLQCMAGHVTNLATVLEDSMPIRSWFMRYNVSHWLPLKMRTRTMRMRRITWPVCRGSKTITFLYARPRFAYSLCNFYWATTTIKGHLLSSRPMLKPFSGEKNS